MKLDGVFLTDINDETAYSAEQDQTAGMCMLILLYILREIILWSGPKIAKRNFQID